MELFTGGSSIMFNVAVFPGFPVLGFLLFPQWLTYGRTHVHASLFLLHCNGLFIENVFHV
jgi:hypothetical protein